MHFKKQRHLVLFRSQSFLKPFLRGTMQNIKLKLHSLININTTPSCSKLADLWPCLQSRFLEISFSLTSENTSSLLAHSLQILFPFKANIQPRPSCHTAANVSWMHLHVYFYMDNSDTEIILI